MNRAGDGHRLIVHYGDARANVVVVQPDASQTDLRLWHVVSRHFSSLGPRAEWRLSKELGAAPTALILRVHAHEDPERPGHVTSYLAVVRMTGEDICVTDRIAASGTETSKRESLPMRPRRRIVSRKYLGCDIAVLPGIGHSPHLLAW